MANEASPVGAAQRSASTAWVDALAATAAIERRPHQVLCHLLQARAEMDGARPALLSDRECFSHAALSARIDAYGRWALRQGLRPGDRVALVMSNRPEYVATWLGLSKAGVVTALINSNLTGSSLAHCLSLAEARHAIVEAPLVAAVRDCLPAAQGSHQAPRLWCHGEGHDDLPRIDRDLCDAAAAGQPWPDIGLADRALLIYTSGTTGLPKAAVVSHRRMLNWALWFSGLLGNGTADRMYNCLPLYHSVGGVVAVAATLVAGGSTVIAEKFSARRFWDDIRRWQCTQVQYIGELCRYLLNAPAATSDGEHGLRVACGNGLRADIWEAFRKRFAIPQIVEFYAATEGNFSLFNVEGKPGAIGRIPSFLRHRFPTAIVRQDASGGGPLRGADGFCVRVAVDEAGEAIGRIGDGSDASGRFEGYTSAAESEGKVLCDVFAKGDRWFRTGDLMRVDSAGYYYFVDRIGDTFRWKGENVATLEVANVLSRVAGVRDVVVYGVSVPGADGRAGMAFLETDAAFDVEALRHRAEAELPGYAVPVFLRLGNAAAVTETFKHRKQDLVRDGFDPAATSDAVFVRRDGQGYVRLDAELYRRIGAGQLRL